jgi:hypothetical protein
VVLDGSASTGTAEISNYLWTVSGPSTGVVVKTFNAGIEDSYVISQFDVPIGGGVTSYTVTLRVTDTAGNTASDTAVLTVPEAPCWSEPPVAVLAGGPQLALSCGKSVAVDGSLSYDPDGNTDIVRYTFVVLDDLNNYVMNKTSTTGKTICYQVADLLQTNTNYIIQLIVTDRSGAAGYTTQDLAVGNCRPIAVNTPPPSGTGVTCGGSLTWSSSGSSDPDGDDLIAWVWRFTSGTHVVTKNGAIVTVNQLMDKLIPGATYTVSLTVRDSWNTASLATTSSMTVPPGCAANIPPVCTKAYPSIARINSNFDHLLRPVYILNVTDADGDPVTISVTKVTQDEWVPGSDTNIPGAWVCPDAVNMGSYAQVAAEWFGATSGGNGRMYVISFTANDGRGGSCTGSVRVCVKSGSTSCYNDGQYHTSTTCA